MDFCLPGIGRVFRAKPGSGAEVMFHFPTETNFYLLVIKQFFNNTINFLSIDFTNTSSISFH